MDILSGLLAEQDQPLEAVHSESTRRIPASMRAISPEGSTRIFFVRNDRSMVRICDTFAMDCLDKPVARRASSTLPGASARRRLVVIATTTMI